MPKVNQVYSLMNDIAKQMWGVDAIKVEDLTSMISLGKQIVGSPANMDKFFGLLVDRIGKTVVRTLDLELDYPELFLDDYSFGCVLQKISTNPFSAQPNSSWEITDPGFSPTLLDGDPGDIIVTYFTDFVTWAFQRKVPSDQIMSTAFSGETQMGAFLDGLTQAFSDSMVMSLNYASRVCINNFMAEKIKADNGIVRPLELYNDVHVGSEIYSAAEAWQSKEFVKFFNVTVKKWIKFMSQPSINYNMGVTVGGVLKPIVRATARDNMHILMSIEAAAALDVYLSETFHNELVSAPLYREVAYWQADVGASDTNDYDTITSIKVTPASEAGALSPTDVEQSGIVCALIDRQAVAIGLNKRRNAAFYNPIDDYTIIKAEASIQYINDVTENGVIFIVEDISHAGTKTAKKKTATE